MDNLEQPAVVMKGGECWLEISMERKLKGLEIWVRVDPRVEEFVKTLGEGDEGTEVLETYGKSWVSGDPNKPIKVTRLNREINNANYNLDSVGTSLVQSRSGPNISFLRFVGVGTPEGVKFIITGPVSRDYIRSIRENVLVAARQLFRDYIAPVHINLRITSTEL